MLYDSNVCTEEEKKKCSEEIGDEEFLNWACAKCEKKKEKEIHPWTKHLLYLRQLTKACYPFGKDDLADFEWFHLGLVNDLIESKRGFKL